MYETTVTFTRQDITEDWFIFSTHDKELLYSHVKFRNDVINAPGFMGLSVAISDNKLEMKVITLWESPHDGQLFFSTNKTGRRFDRALALYTGRCNVMRTVSTVVLPDTAKLKAKKLSSRLTVEQANEELKEFLTQERTSTIYGEHAVFLTEDEIPVDIDDEQNDYQ